MEYFILFALLWCNYISALELSNHDMQVVVDDSTGAVMEIRDPTATSQMNWISAPQDAPWQPLSSRWGLGYGDLGASWLHRAFWNSPQTSSTANGTFVAVYVSGPLELTVTRSLAAEGGLDERYVFKNTGSSNLNLASTAKNALGIYTPFNDHYTNTSDSLSARAHTHVWANGGSSAWVKTSKMGGSSRNLGLVVTEGALSGYSIESRDLITQSNTCGVFLLHPSIATLSAGESATLSWTLFWQDNWDDFFSQCMTRSRQFIKYDATTFSPVLGDQVTITLTGESVNAETKVNGQAVLCNSTGCRYVYNATTLGEKILPVVNGDGKSSTITLNVVSKPQDLIASRTKFIASKQQMSAPGTPTDGAYMVYDNEANAIATWDTDVDRNAGRERVGMGVLMSRWLRIHPDQRLQSSLIAYYNFVCTKLQDDTGLVYNRPIGTGSNSRRLYNWPWIMQLHLTIAQLNLNITGPAATKSPIERFMLTMENFYSLGGSSLYAIGLPILEALRYLEMTKDYERLARAKSLFISHGETLARNGLNYPRFEVNFEQSIVAPASIIMLELYRYTKNETWLEAAEPHVEALMRFSGKQPDYHLHHIPIRHWDGYWFGKERFWGDVFPHHWSALNAISLHHYSKSKSDSSYEVTAQEILRGNMALFDASGKASAAWIYPLAVNGRAAYKKDPYANDQDWALAHYLQIQADNGYCERSRNSSSLQTSGSYHGVRHR